MALPLWLAACGGAPPGDAASVAGRDTIACATTRSADLARQCTVERVATRDGPTLTVRQPDGGFRRLLIVADGRGVVAADGAEPVRVTVVSGNEIEAAVGAARYRLPAQVRVAGR